MGSKIFACARSCSVCFLSKLHKGSSKVTQPLVRKVSEHPALHDPVYEQAFSSPLRLCVPWISFLWFPEADRMKKCRAKPALLWAKAGSSPMLSGAGLQVQACSFRPTLTYRPGHKNIFWKVLQWFLVCCCFLLPGCFCTDSKAVWQGRAVSKQCRDNSSALLSCCNLSSQVSFLSREISGIFHSDKSCAVGDMMVLHSIPLTRVLI